MNVLIIVPTYNERDSLPALARRIMADTPYSLLVVDDASQDGTGAVADGLADEYPGRIEVMHRTGTRGLGLSYLDAFRHALAGDADLICQMDADLSHDPRYLPDLVQTTSETHDVVVGSRYVGGISVVNWPLRRVILSTFANWYVRTVTGLTIRDATSGYRCWRRQALAGLPLDRIVSQRYAFLVETVFEAARSGSAIGEVPIIFIERRQGTSKMSVSVLLESMVMPWRLFLRNRGRLARRAVRP